jgi:hypothetical protein
LNRENKNQNQFQVDWTVRNWRENKWGPEPPLHDDWWIFLEFQKVVLTAGDGAQVKEMVIEDKSDDTPTAVFIMGK